DWSVTGVQTCALPISAREREIHIIPCLAFAERNGADKVIVAGLLLRDISLQHHARLVIAFGQVSQAVTPVSVSQRAVILSCIHAPGFHKYLLVPQASLELDLHQTDPRIRGRGAADGHTPADRSRARAIVALRRLRD